VARRLSQLAALPVTVLNGVGAKKAESLAEIEIHTVLDLLTHYPRRYLDRTDQKSIRDLQVGEEALVLGTVKRVNARRTRQGRALVEVDIFDGSSYLKVTFFNQGWRAKQLSVGTEAAFFGKVDVYRGRRQMTNPVVDLVGTRTGRIVPMYPQSEKAGLTSYDFEPWINEALERAGVMVDPLPEAWRDRLDVVDRTWALNQIHNPESMGAAQAARKRLALDELLRLQVILVMRKRAIERESKGIRHRVDGPLVDRFRAALPFPLTGAQERAIAEIAADLGGPHPMHRLLQGDVGSGKTVVAVATLLVAVQGGFQGALMAPTEVLAEQHHLGVRELLADLTVPDESGSLFEDRPLQVALLTNRTTATERTKLHAALESGGVDILIGTHALLTERVAFKSLGAVVIDEQHRFGVEQRAALRGKGDDPDVLVMTATPIPRTAAMTVYGDLDSTILNELPPGRTPVATTWARGELEETAAWTKVIEEVGEGRQVYVVCPLVEDSERIQARSATEEFDRLRDGQLKGLRLGLLHGQMPAKEKEAVMAAFRRHELDVLVATTVIEVGVDVPNAAVMVVEHAERFGLAQLHQLRGRIGRGAAKSYCVLMTGGKVTEDAERRLDTMVKTQDGFEIAETDLQLRGPGEVFGTRQAGMPSFRVANPLRDRELLELARREAAALVGGESEATQEEKKLAMVHLRRHWQRRYGLVEVG
jgi:ATP-dependent DNA helicase RecG